MQPLGDIQLGVLRALNREPYPGGWYWENHSKTKRVLDSLVKRGLAKHETRTYSTGRKYGRYEITEAGKELLR